MGYVPLITCIVSLIFAITVLDQYFARRKPFQLLWSIGLFMYSLSTLTEFWWNIVGHVDLFYGSGISSAPSSWQLTWARALSIFL